MATKPKTERATYGFLFILIIGLSACDTNRVYEKNIEIQSSEWLYSDTLQFAFNIKNKQQTYNVYTNVRHSFYYNWSNIWVNWQLISPDSTFIQDLTNIPLAEPSGKWFGQCSGELCDLSYPLLNNFTFPDTGNYVFNIVQEMRENPLPNVLSMGLRVEKTENNE